MLEEDLRHETRREKDMDDMLAWVSSAINMMTHVVFHHRKINSEWSVFGMLVYSSRTVLHLSVLGVFCGCPIWSTESRPDTRVPPLLPIILNGNVWADCDANYSITNSVVLPHTCLWADKRFILLAVFWFTGTCEVKWTESLRIWDLPVFQLYLWCSICPFHLEKRHIHFALDTCEQSLLSNLAFCKESTTLQFFYSLKGRESLESLQFTQLKMVHFNFLSNTVLRRQNWRGSGNRNGNARRMLVRGFLMMWALHYHFLSFLLPISEKLGVRMKLSKPSPLVFSL